MIGERNLKMIGGQIIVPIRGVNGEKISITTTAQNIKPGTYAKIKRAVEMQKELVLEDVSLNEYPVTSSGNLSFETIVTSSGIGAFCFHVTSTNSTSGNIRTLSLFINSNDTALYS